MTSDPPIPSGGLGSQLPPFELGLVEWLVGNRYVSLTGLYKLRQALTTDDVVLGFSPRLFDAREELLTHVDEWIGSEVERTREFNREHGLGEYNADEPPDPAVSDGP